MIPRREQRQDRADGRPIEHGPEARARSLRRSSFERVEDGALTTPLSTPRDGAEAADPTPGCRVSMPRLPGKPSSAGAVRQTGKERRCKGRAGRRRARTPLLEQLQTRVVPAGTWTAFS